MRRVWLAMLMVALVAMPAAPAAAEEEEFVFEGGGWGHGVGFSQYGARGQGIESPEKAGEDIAAYYYTGAEPASLADLDLSTDLLDTADNPLWVGLAQNVQMLEFRPVGGPLELCQEGSPCPLDLVPAAGETWTFERIDAGECGWFVDGVQQGDSGPCDASISWPAADGIVLEDRTNTTEICGSHAGLDACEYRRGELKLRDDPVEVGFHVTLAIGLEEYLYGLRELPDDWTRSNVNEAQVVAARSYAAVEFLSREIPAQRTADDAGLSSTQQDLCWCHTYDDTRDQFFTGWSKEATAPHWVEAVDATAGRVLTYFGEDWEWSTEDGILQGFYSSSTAGSTESNIGGFGSSVQYPYLHPVADPWSQDPAVGNPFDAWAITVAASTITAALGVDEVLAVQLVQAAPGATAAFTVVDDGVTSTVEKGGAWMRTALGLRSTGVLAIDGVGASPALPFDDIAGSVHQDAIVAINEAGITIGCDADSFCINEVVLRGQMASFIARAIDLPPSVTDHVTDDLGNTHEENINRIYDAAIALGCGEALYCPNEAITREHMAVFLYRALDLPDAEVDVFDDDNGSPYEHEINALAAAGITNGCTDGSYCPDEAVSRGQMASFLFRAFLDGTT